MVVDNVAPESTNENIGSDGVTVARAAVGNSVSGVDTMYMICLHAHAFSQLAKVKSSMKDHTSSAHLHTL